MVGVLRSAWIPRVKVKAAHEWCHNAPSRFAAGESSC